MSRENKFEDRHEARELAVETLYALDFNDELSSDSDLTLLPGKSEEEMKALSEEVLFYARYLVTGVLSHLDEIDGIISRYSINRPLDKINFVDRNVLRIAVFSLLYEKDLHPSIVINEAVKLSQEMSTDVTYKFINGMLDNISKKEISR
ncbi:MAG: transcription antitermination factor NusB [Bullifex sp.]